MEETLKHKTARSIKWNIIDRVASQLLYAVTGIILARQLSEEAFGLVGALLIFQSYALMMIESGFSYALIQRKRPTETDYSSVFWFNLLTAVVIYIILYLCAPFIADLFKGDERLVDLSRVMFLSFILNASAIVQTNRLMKRMDFRPIAVTNALGLIVGAIVGIGLAYSGVGAWAIVWQQIAIQATKSVALWVWCRWIPRLVMSWTALRSYFKVGGGMLGTSFLNVTFQNIYSFFIGNMVGLKSLGYYTQADKWSKMGVTAISQVLGTSFLPALSEVQDDPERFARVASKMNRFTAYLLFPAIIFLAVMATPIFHVLFGAKWDPSIILFQLLLVRGTFTVLNTVYNNYLIALGHTRLIFRLEMLRDIAAVVGIVLALPHITISTPTNIVYGLEILLWGQVAASFITWVATLIVTCRTTHLKIRTFLLDLMPYLTIAAVIGVAAWSLTLTSWPDWIVLIAQFVVAAALYIAANAMLQSRIQRDVFAFVFKRKRSATESQQV